MAKEDAIVVEEFKKIVIANLKDVATALPALVPQSKEDTILFKRGMVAFSNLIYQLEHTETIRDIGRYIDIRSVANDFDIDSIKTLRTQINSNATASVRKLSNMVDMLNEDE